jgi:preprotein translocase subunit SecA
MLNPLKIISKFIKSSNQKNLDNLRSIAEKVNELENDISSLKDEEFPSNLFLTNNHLQLKC